MKGFLKNSKNISFFSVGVFLVVAVVLLASTCYMNFCIMREENAYTNNQHYKQLGADLAATSDYLTSEVRLFSINHDMENFYNYWIEINETKTRENVIESFENSDTSDEETACLKEAKRNSDELVEVERLAMKLVLLSEHKTAEDFADDVKLQGYVKHVLECEIPDSYKNMTDDELADCAVILLYDSVYQDYKERIKAPIEAFKNLVNERLDSELAQTKNGTSVATILLLGATSFTLISIACLLLISHKMYVTPICNYTRSINNVYAPTVKVEPQGAEEFVTFGKAFNRLVDTVYEELENRKSAEESMRIAKREAVVASHAKSIFLASMSHELRLPLNAVNGYTELLMETDLTERQDSYVRGLRSSSECLLGTINDILDYSKFESGNLAIEHSAFNLGNLLNEVRYVTVKLAEQKNLSFELNCDENIPPVLVGDSLRLRQLLVNLANNGVKFTSKGGVTIDITLLRKAEKECDIRFSVSDTGIGIDKESAENIFKPFVQRDASVARKYGGTGLGLSICSQIVKGWTNGAGEIKLESEVGKGSTFSFELGFGISDEIIEDDKLSTPIFNGSKILITDDNEINMKIEAEMLEKCRLTVITANGGDSSVEIMRENPDIKLVFMDIRMPGTDGYTAAAEIRKIPEHGNTPIVALTGDVSPETEEKARQSGMNGYLKKPFRKRELYAVLKKYLPDYTEADSEKKSHLEVASQYFSPEALLKKLGGKSDVFELVMNMFITDYDNFLQKFEKLKTSNNVNEAYEQVHKLKGTAGSMCCQRLFERSDILCDSLKNNSFDGYGEFSDTFTKTYFEVSEYYETFVADKHSKENKNSRIAVLNKMLEYCDNGDFAIANCFGENISMLRRNCKAENFVRIKRAVEQLDFKKLKVYLEKELSENV